LRDVLRPTLGACVNDASEWPKARCVEAVRAHGLPMPEGAEKPPTANELKETLRPAVQPGACTPTLVLPTGHAAGALMNNAKAFKAFTALHATRVAVGAPPLLADLDIGRGRGVHRRVAEEKSTAPSLARRVTRAHSKIVVALYRKERSTSAATSANSSSPPQPSFGWAYVGSHNFSPTAWGDPSRPSAGDAEMIQMSSWEIGVVLTVPRGTAREEARLSMSFDSWPLPFDAMEPHAYAEEEVEAAEDSFAMLEAAVARMQGDPDWEDKIPPDVRQRRWARTEAAQQETELEEMEEMLVEAAKQFSTGAGVQGLLGGRGDEGEASHGGDLARREDQQLATALRASLAESEEEAIARAVRDSLMDGAAGARPVGERKRPLATEETRERRLRHFQSLL